MPRPPFEHLLRHLSAGIATLEGPELRYGFVNERMRSLVGAAAVGQRLADHPGALPASLVAVAQQVFAAGEPYVAKACVCETVAGAERVTHCFDFSLDFTTTTTTKTR